jgi:hypothetical protein
MPAIGQRADGMAVKTRSETIARKFVKHSFFKSTTRQKVVLSSIQDRFVLSDRQIRRFATISKIVGALCQEAD